MSATLSPSARPRFWIGLLVVAVLVAATWGFFAYRATWPRGEALEAALKPLIDKKGTEQSLVASAILDNYVETRANASRWSGIYWGFTFAAAALSALAGLVLKLESLIKKEAVKKDIAALFSIAAALLITISTSGDFQRKWQANRIAAAELERTGYELLEKDGANPRSYLANVGQVLLRRHMAIVGSTEQARRPTEPAGTPASQK